MLNAIGLHHIRWRKKKVDGFIIPANYYYGRVFDIAVEEPEIIHVEPIAAVIPHAIVAEPEVPERPIEPETPSVPIVSEHNETKPGLNTEVKISSLSLASIRAKRELLESNKSIVKEVAHLPTEEFNETDMLLQWTKFAQRLSDKGQKIMESLLLINDPKLKGTTIIHELPNEGSKIDFESGMPELLGYLRGKLHNHDIEIKVVVNESMDNRKAFTPQDRFNRLNEINPSLELLRKTFDLDI